MPKFFYHAPKIKCVIVVDISKNYDCYKVHLGLQKLFKTYLEKIDQNTYNAYKKIYEG